MSVFHTVLNDHAKAKCCYPVTGSCTCGLHQHAQQDHAETCEDQTNPKDLLGVKKVQLGLFPAAASIYGALALQDGAAKYGPYNWRDKKVRMTVYLDALERHLIALRDGENEASDSGVHHIGHILGCAAIIADAMSGGFLVDDRPPAGPAASLLEQFRKKEGA